MKKIISILLISLLVLGLAACGDTSQNKRVDENPAVEESNKNDTQNIIISRENKPNEQESVSDPSGKNVLVVYFSVTGNTKTRAYRKGMGTYLRVSQWQDIDLKVFVRT